MSIRKIKDAKDLNNNELIYFKSHAKATYMSDGSTVEDTILNIELSIELDRQVIILSKDKPNGVSFYVNTSLEEVQKELGDKGILIATTPSNSNVLSIISTYNTETGLWEGNMTNLDFRLGYSIEVSEDITISVTGKPLNPKDYAIPYGKNRMIGYPYNKSIEINDALANVPNPQEGDIFRIIGSRTEYATYTSGSWVGTLETIKPGRCYSFTLKENYNPEATFTYLTELDAEFLKYETKEDSAANLQEAKNLLFQTIGNSLRYKADVDGNPNGIVVKEEDPHNSINIHPYGMIESESYKYNDSSSTEWIPDFTLSGNSLALGSGIGADDGFKIEALLNIRTQDRSDEEFLRTSHTMILQFDERGNAKGTGLLLTDDFILLYAYNPESEIDISENITELESEVPFNDVIFDTRLRGIAEPVSNHDAVNKKYVDDNYVSVNNIKTINGLSLLGEGNIVISGGETDMSNYYTKEEIDNTVGDINTILESIING